MRAALRLRSREVAFLLVGLLSVALGVAAYATSALDRLELDTVDLRFAARGEQPVKDVVVVEIDDVTLDELDEQWPFPRSYHARLIDRLREAGAGTIAFDVQFTEPTTRRQDNALIGAVDRARPVVLATTEVDRRGRSKVFGGEQVLSSLGARSGNTGLEPDTGGVVRRVPYQLDGLESFPIVVAEVAEDRTIDRSELPGDEVWIDFAGPPGTVPSASYSRVLDGRVPDRRLRGKVVVVGASAPRLQDLHQTPFSKGTPMPGAEVLANAVATVRDGFPLRPSGTVLGVLLIALLGMAAPAASLRMRPVAGLGGALAIGVGYIGAAQLVFRTGTILPVVYPLGALAVSAVAALAVHYVSAAIERAQTRQTFARFVPQQVVDEVLDRAGDGCRLGGVRRECTVMFSDLRGFTTFAESREPDAVVEVLNRYLGSMTDAIMDAGGTLVSYMGDGIMAVFGAPLDQADHADRALRAAREMTGPRLERFNAWLVGSGLGDEGFRIGVGLNTGVVLAGNVGSERRMEYTTIGDTTNTAARLEGMTKGTRYMVFVAGSTRDAMVRPPTDLDFVDELEVRGRTRRLAVWGLRGSPRSVGGQVNGRSGAFPSGEAPGRPRTLDV
jgi:adenylate cyclase